jgi:hypothetical protein
MLDIFWRGEPVGELNLRPDGLYLQCDAVCHVREMKLLRLWLVGRERREYFGVLAPEDGKWTLHRRLPLRGFREADWTFGELEAESEPWQPFHGTVAGLPVPDGMSRCCDGRRELALPFDPNEPFPYLPLLPRLRVCEIEGKSYFVIHDMTGLDAY